MPKHRSTVYTVVREVYDNSFQSWEFSGLIGTYASATRADEIAAKTMQEYVDKGMNIDDPDYAFSVQPSTWYEE